MKDKQTFRCLNGSLVTLTKPEFFAVWRGLKSQGLRLRFWWYTPEGEKPVAYQINGAIEGNAGWEASDAYYVFKTFDYSVAILSIRDKLGYTVAKAKLEPY